MPTPKRVRRASGVSRSLTGRPRNALVQCLCCGRWLPRTAIAHVGRKAFYRASDGRRVPRAFCGECYHSGEVWRRGVWAVEGSERKP